MNIEPLSDFSKLCIHTITTKPWSIDEIADNFSREGIGAISVWRDSFEGKTPKRTGELLRNHGLEIVSYCRGGFFAHSDVAKRQSARDENKKTIDEAFDLGAPLIVLVCGAVSGQPLSESRKQIHDGIESILNYTEAAKVKLAIEPLHPMFADDRSAINTLGQANDMAEAINSPWVGVAVDVYHLWWDPDLEREIARCGKNDNLFAFHICDWKTPTETLLLDRGLMGEGCIPVPQIRSWVEEAGFAGYHEVEIFSKKYWAGDQSEYLKKIKEAYLKSS